MELPAKRQNKNRVLFEFDSIVDMRLAIVRALQRDYPSGGPAFNNSFLSKTLRELKISRLIDIGKDPVVQCFKNPDPDVIRDVVTLYTDEEHFIETAMLAPVTDLVKLLKQYSFACNGAITSHILCHDPLEEKIMKAITNGVDLTILTDSEENVNVNMYARIIVGDAKQIDKFKNVEYVHLTVLNYGSNLQIVKGTTMIDPYFITMYGDINQLEVVTPYNIPIEVKEDVPSE